MLNTRNKRNSVVFLGVTLIVIGIFVLANNYFNEKIDNAYSYMNNLLLEEEIYEMQEEVDNIEESASSFQEEEQKEEEYVDPYLNYYIGKLEIPKINLSRGFLSMDSPYNHVDRNIQIIKGSTYPDVDKGNFILAAHSGNSYLSYFHNLYKLSKGDMAYINYQNKRYSYKIVNIYEQAKTGKIAIYRDANKTTLTLVTCTRNKSDKQTVYILELQDIKDI